MAYAATTSVSVEKSRTEIERLLERHKARQYGTAVDYETQSARVQFRLHDRVVRFVLALPDETNFRVRAKFEQAERQKWRALFLVIKAKLESVESQIGTFEEEFMAHIVMPNDKTVGEILTPLIAESYGSGKMPRLLSAGAEK